MEEEFYSTVKLVSGEELVAKVCYLTDEDSLLIENPMIVEPITQKKGKQKVEGFILKEWISSSYDDVFIIRMDKIITLSELEENIKEFYLSCLEKKNSEPQEPRGQRIDFGDYNNSARQSLTDLSEKGYIGSVEKHKKILEEIFKKS